MGGQYTPSQTVGPFYSFALCTRPLHLVVPEEAPGALRIRGRVFDGAGEGIPDAMVEIRQADGSGGYLLDSGWGRCGTDADGGFEFVTLKPGPVSAGGQRQAPHLNVLVFARGLLKPLLTRMYFPDEEPANAADPVLAGIEAEERATLVAQPEDGLLRFDIHLQGSRQTTFFGL